MSQQRGFTLLEMLAALAVLAVCTTVLLGAFGQGARALHNSAEAAQLSEVARSVIDSLDDGPLVPGRQQGAWGEVAWSCDIGLVPAPSGMARLFRLDLTVWGNGQVMRASTLRVRAGGAGS